MHIITNHIYVFIVEQQKESSTPQTNAAKWKKKGEPKAYREITKSNTVFWWKFDFEMR